MNDKIFRSYDIRGKYGSDITEEVAYLVGLGYGSILQEKYQQETCIVSHDNRISSPSLYENLIKGILDSGLNVISYGLTTTPMNYFIRHQKKLFGVMVTASHNPSDENGFKFSFDHYANARGSMITEFRDYIKDGKFLKGHGTLTHENIKSDYINYLKNNTYLGDKKIKVVFDPANGAVTSVLDDVLKEFNIDYIIINKDSDGTFPKHSPDPSIEANLSMLKDAVIKYNADLGIGFDGDGDRIGIIDNTGSLVSIEDYAILITRDIFETVANKKFLYDAKCSDIYKDEIIRLGGTPVICQTGSSYTQEKVIRENLPFGIQYVGHISINDRYFSTESAIYSSLRLIELLSKSDKTLHELTSNLPKYENIPEMRIMSTDTKKLEVIANIKKYCIKHNYEYIEIDGLKVQFNGAWAYVRSSNTGPTINFRAEARDKKDLDNIVKLFTTLIELFNK